MVRDPMNYDQLTWKQIRKQITAFKSSGAPFAEYLKDRGLMPIDGGESSEEVSLYGGNLVTTFDS